MDLRSSDIPEHVSLRHDLAGSAPLDGSCPPGEVLIIAAHEDPAHSSASLRMADGGMATRRAGESIRGFLVEAIHWDRISLRRGEQRCELHIGEAPAPTRSAPRAPKTHSGRIPGWLARSMQRTGPGEIAVQRSAVDRIVSEAAMLIRGTRAVPTEDGVRLSRVRGVLANLGFKPGDVLHEVNGFDLHDPKQMLQAYAKLRTADRLRLSFSRAGKRGELDVSVL